MRIRTRRCSQAFQDLILAGHDDGDDLLALFASPPAKNRLGWPTLSGSFESQASVGSEGDEMPQHAVKRYAGAIVLVATAMLLGQAGAIAAQCCGDCNGDDQVTVDEIVTAISRALSGCSDDGVCNASVETCNTDLLNLQITLDATRADLAVARENLSECSAVLSDLQIELELCNGEVAACLSAPRVQQTGQTRAYGIGTDANVGAGALLSYTDNGDGTITDNNTNLMWEKKDNSGGIHDASNTYTWAAVVSGAGMDGTISTTFLAALNDGNGFAGHKDWRIPNIKELLSIVDYGGLVATVPAVDAAFHQTSSCPGCADVTAPACSCTGAGVYWSSSTYELAVEGAWVTDFSDGITTHNAKSEAHRARAVRGGL